MLERRFRCRAFPPELRRAIYTTNAIEALKRQLRHDRDLALLGKLLDLPSKRVPIGPIVGQRYCA
jgi:hypothetical protein